MRPEIAQTLTVLALSLLPVAAGVAVGWVLFGPVADRWERRIVVAALVRRGATRADAEGAYERFLDQRAQRHRKASSSKS